jgi:hypothetical protein
MSIVELRSAVARQIRRSTSRAKPSASVSTGENPKSEVEPRAEAELAQCRVHLIRNRDSRSSASKPYFRVREPGQNFIDDVNLGQREQMAPASFANRKAQHESVLGAREASERETGGNAPMVRSDPATNEVSGRTSLDRAVVARGPEASAENQREIEVRTQREPLDSAPERVVRARLGQAELGGDHTETPPVRPIDDGQALRLDQRLRHRAHVPPPDVPPAANVAACADHESPSGKIVPSRGSCSFRVARAVHGTERSIV